MILAILERQGWEGGGGMDDEGVVLEQGSDTWFFHDFNATDGQLIC